VGIRSERLSAPSRTAHDALGGGTGTGMPVLVSQCGCYRMSQALILVMMEEGQIFDTERMRAWLVSRRELMPIPTIDHSQAILAG